MQQTCAGRLKQLKLYKENSQYYFDATYLHENDSEIYETHIPKIQIPQALYDPTISVQRKYGENLPLMSEAYIDLEFQWALPVEKVTKTKHTYEPVEPTFFSIKLIAEKTKEMTIEEIEEKLGHKIKIVNKKED